MLTDAACEGKVDDLRGITITAAPTACYWKDQEKLSQVLNKFMKEGPAFKASVHYLVCKGFIHYLVP